MKPSIFFLVCALGLFASTRAEAQNGDLRLSLDADMFSVSFVNVEVDTIGNPEAEYTIIGFGPNQHGSARVVPAPTPVGFGIGYGISNRLVLGLRTGLGLDVIDQDGVDEKVKIFALSLMPGLTFIPLGNKTKLFINLSALFQVNREKQDDRKDRVLLGGFSTGIGALIFPASRFSADLGFFFEGRFGGREFDDPDLPDQDIRDLRALIRLGFSLWK